MNARDISNIQNYILFSMARNGHPSKSIYNKYMVLNSSASTIPIYSLQTVYTTGNKEILTNICNNNSAVTSRDIYSAFYKSVHGILEYKFSYRKSQKKLLFYRFSISDEIQKILGFLCVDKPTEKDIKELISFSANVANLNAIERLKAVESSFFKKLKFIVSEEFLSNPTYGQVFKKVYATCFSKLLEIGIPIEIRRSDSIEEMFKDTIPNFSNITETTEFKENINKIINT